MFSIYCITNKSNGKKYIGMTVRTIFERWKAHLSCAKNGSPFRFHSAIRKYGEEDWILEYLSTNLTQEEARIMEEHYIQEHNSMTHGYNAKPGGCGGWIVPEEKYAQWVKTISKNTTGQKNPNHSGLSDTQIAELVYNFYLNDPDEFSIRRAKQQLNKTHKVPLALKRDYRFVEDGGGDSGLRNHLIRNYQMSPEVFSRKSRTHKENISKANLGKNWYFDPVTWKCYQMTADDAEKLQWIKGRRNAKNK